MALLVKRFAETVTCFAFNGDGTKLALCPNNEDIHIYAKQGNDWKREVILKEHTQIVTGLDWGKSTNRIVSCSQDRNAYVWTLDGKAWKPTLVILRLNRAATFVKWSPKEDKFAVASGAKLVSICYFEEDNDWWVSKHVKRHRSTVLSVKWHPNNILIATASSDFKARVFSAWTKGVDKRGTPCPIPDVGKRAEKFGEVLAEFESNGWVTDVDWSPSGNQLAWVGHDATLGVADITSGQSNVLKLAKLPISKIVFHSEGVIVGGGHNCEPFQFEGGAGGWKLARELDPKVAAQPKKGPGAFKKFQNLTTTGQEEGTKKLLTKHQNAITWVARAPNGSVVTSGLDGNMIWWKV